LHFEPVCTILLLIKDETVLNQSRHRFHGFAWNPINGCSVNGQPLVRDPLTQEYSPNAMLFALCLNRPNKEVIIPGEMKMRS
jgi:hypothetical protein